MKFQNTARILIVIMFLGVAAAVKAQAKMPVGKIKITDGDTVSVRFENRQPLKIRLAAIDAPERKQPFGKKCASRLRTLLKGEQMEIEKFGVDRYGRTLGRIWRDNADVNLEMVKIGCAWIYDNAKILPIAERKIYQAAFESARDEKLGLFVKENPVEPKEFRRLQKRKR